MSVSGEEGEKDSLSGGQEYKPGEILGSAGCLLPTVL